MKEEKKKLWCEATLFCWRKAAGHMERKFVMTERFYVCQYHADKLMKQHVQDEWRGKAWSNLEFIALEEKKN